jgi:hypothetical protein
MFGIDGRSRMTLGSEITGLMDNISSAVLVKMESSCARKLVALSTLWFFLWHELVTNAQATISRKDEGGVTDIG